jgi:shikimate kinase
MDTLEILPLKKTIVLVGMMGVGKTSIGRLLASRLHLPFHDSDHAVEEAADLTVSEIFEWYGEEAFKDVEMRVIGRLLKQPPHVLSTGVGAFVVEENRQAIKSQATSIWLNASYKTLYDRVSHRTHRPQIESVDKAEKLKKYMNDFSPYYAEADYQIQCDGKSPSEVVALILTTLGLQHEHENP